MQPLADAFGRVATDLRVSLTDRCNLRCTYCMPEEGLDWLPLESQLSDDEVVRLITVAVERLGVREVRFTGGEPLVRRGLVDIVRRTAALEPRPETSLTTNALGLAKTAQALKDAGLDRVNVSLDTVRSETFHEITRRDRFADVVAGLEAAQAAGMGPVKVNAVLLRGVNDDQAPDLLEWCLERGYALRFIEQMPLDAQHGWSRDEMVTADEILETLEAALRAGARRGAARQCAGRAVPRRRRSRHGRHHRLGHPAVLRRLRPGPAHRRRPGPQLPVRPRGVRPAHRDARRREDAELAERWIAAMATKKPGHGIDDPTFLQPDRPMSAIGG